MRVPRLFATASLILVAGSATACSSGSSPAVAGGAPAATTSKAVTAGGGSGAATGTVTDFDVCAALPAPTAAQITGKPFTTVKTSTVQGIIFGCEYSDAGSDLLQVSVTTKDGKIGFDTDVSALGTVGHRPNSLSGVGTEAFSEPDPNGNAGSVGASAFASFGALYGDTYVKIGGLTYVTAAQGTTIANLLHSKL